MSKETAIGMLRVGNTGDDILQILDVIAEETDAPTMVDFNGNPTTIWY